jgi:hypothetical protein
MNFLRTHNLRVYTAVAVWLCFALTACEREPRVSAYSDAGTIEQRYGLAGTYNDRLSLDNRNTDATIVPVTLSDGRTAQLVIPKRGSGDHRVFLRDENGLSPVVLDNPRVTRDEFIRSQPRVVQRTVVDEPKRKKRSWQKEALIVGGSSGAGAAIGAVAGGKKGAAVGAVTGGIAGLIYDLATRNK